MMDRRRFLQISGMAALLGAGGSACSFVGGRRVDQSTGEPLGSYEFDPISEENFQQKLFIPGDSGPFGVLDVGGPLQINATAASFPILKGQASPFLLYQTEQAGKDYQNPILRIESGSRFQATLHNQLADPTIIHWHGLHTSAAMDGGPASSIAPDSRYEYDFTVNNRGGTYWYHSHAHELTAEQAYGGLASFFLVEDEDQRRLRKALDLRLGETDIPIVIQDKRFDAAGKMLYQPNMGDSMMGWLGDVILANLTPNAYLTVTPRIYRFRLLNGSNSRIYRLAFHKAKTSLNFSVIGTDGGLLDRPYSVSEAFLAPGERLDVLFDAGQIQSGDTVFLKSLAFDPMENEGSGMGGTGGMMGGMTSSRLPLGAEFNILKLTVTDGKRVAATPPEVLSKVIAIRSEGVPKRKIELSMDHMRFLINGRSYRMDEISLEVKRGAVEIWSISNPTQSMPHPMHIHGFSFQVVERLNSPSQMSAGGRFDRGRTVSDLGWKDTVLVWPGETVNVAVDFAHDFPGSQDYVFHCHNLEHEDAGMMINYRVQA
ncbi:MAG: multicopper oxidase domain-containing protein [Acidobacteriota bacterium]